MKRPPNMQKLDDLLRSGQLVAGGFLGSDTRPVEEIIEADAATLEQLGVHPAELGRRMAELTREARAGLGSFVDAGDHLEVACDDNRGVIVCPWGDGTRHYKSVTTARRTDTGRTVRWSDLSAHLIARHGFFQGKGSPFRIEPRDLVEVIL
ncbi:MAG: hypothetical protein ACOC95_05130 [Planctomycetota bacterium]